jgi:hypothetical protein
MGTFKLCKTLRGRGDKNCLIFEILVEKEVETGGGIFIGDYRARVG